MDGKIDDRTDNCALTHLEMYFRLPGPTKFTRKQISDIKACASGLISREELYDRYFLFLKIHSI